MKSMTGKARMLVVRPRASKPLRIMINDIIIIIIFVSCYHYSNAFDISIFILKINTIIEKI